jgi:hypothetical protein
LFGDLLLPTIGELRHKTLGRRSFGCEAAHHGVLFRELPRHGARRTVQ